MNIHSQKGSALYIALIFSIVTLATASIYVIHQMNFAVVSRKDPAKLQALLNARSGIWYALAILDREVDEKGSRADSADTAMTEALFGEDMFRDFKSNDTEKEIPQDLSVASSEQPVSVSLFDNMVAFTFSLDQSFYFRIVESEGTFREHRKRVSATIATKPFVSPDTVLFLSTAGIPEGFGNVQGRIAFLEQSIDKSDSLQRKRFFIDRDELRTIINAFQESLTTQGDTGVREEPLTVQYNDDFSQVPDTVYGPLFIDGSSRDLFWKTGRKIYVIEELQVTGDVILEDVRFVVRGDIKILDNTVMKSVELFTSSRIFFAGESRFHGNALACGDVEIYEQAVIGGKSIIISAGTSKKVAPNMKTGAKKLPENTVAKTMTAHATPTPDKNAKKAKKNEKLYSLFVRDQAMVDGVLIDLNAAGGISTDMETIISGILWTQGRLCHRGRMKGVVKARVLVDEAEPKNIQSNSLAGTIKELESIDTYYLPYFIGEPALVAWKEM